MERRDFLKLSGTVTAGLALAPIDVIEGMAVVSTTTFFVYALQWSKDGVKCEVVNCQLPEFEGKPLHHHIMLQLNRYMIDAFDEEDARMQVMALIPNGEGKVSKVTKVADATGEWV